MLTSLLTLLAIARVWNRAFWRKPGDAEHPDPVLLAAPADSATGDRAGKTNVTLLPRTMVGSTLGLVVFGVALTVFAGPLFRVADQSAQEMLDRTSYIQAVLGPDAPVPPVPPSLHPVQVRAGRRKMNRKRISLRQELPLLVWLVFVWGALWQNFSPGNLLFGALIAVLVARIFYLPPVELGGRFNVLRAVPFALIFLGKVVAASFQVLYLAVVRGPKVVSAVVAVPLRSHSDLLVTATGHVISLIPGSLVVEVDRSTSTLYIHGINVRNAEDAAKLRKEVRDTEAGLIRIMGTKAELSALTQETAA